MSSIVARRYAKALLELGRETGQIDQMVEGLTNLGASLKESDDLRKALDNPLVALEAKRAILNELAGAMGLDASTRNTLHLLNDRRRVRLIPEIAKMLREMNDARKGLVRAEVITAVKLPESYYAKLQVQLEKMTGKRVIVDTHEDPSIIGGVIARIGDTVIDGSVRARLDEMKNALLNQQAN